jgi:hypothetical protein
MRKPATLSLIAIFSLALAACGGGDNEDGPQYASTVALESLTPDGCLNVPAYFSGITALNPGAPILEVSTDFSYSSKRSVRDKFGELMAYTTFRAGARPLQEFGEFSSVSQIGCTELLIHAADGSTESFPVSQASPESIRAEASDGRLFQYTWLSPTRMIIDLKYHAYDMPCGGDEPVLIRQRRVLDWSGAPLESFDLNAEPFNMNDSYLAKVANAVGMSAGNLYDDGSINPAKVREMAGRPPVPELLTCPDGGLSPPRENPGDEPETPTDP